MELWHIPLLFTAGLIAGIVNTLAGGGSMLTLPALIFFGLPPSLANGTNRVAVLIQCIIATASFHKNGVSRFRFALILSVPAVLGAIVGAQISVSLPDRLFQSIIAIVILFMVALTIWNPTPKNYPHETPAGKRKILSIVVFFFIGMYGGFIQVGVGYPMTAALTVLCGFDLVLTAGVKVFMVGLFTAAALIVFIVNGEVDWSYALVLSLGNGLGGWLGTKIALKKGENWIKIVLAVSVTIMALKLLGLIPPFSK